MDIHLAFTNISDIIDGANLREMDILKRQKFIIPILKDLQKKSFIAGKKEARIEAIKHLKSQL
jgi:hypothetical protein